MSAYLVAEAFVTLKGPSAARSIDVLIADPAIADALREGLGRFVAVLRAERMSA
jgi:hypothetical protein